MAVADTLIRKAGKNLAAGATEGAPKRAAMRLWPMALFAASFAVSWIPGFGGAFSHVFDRMKNKSDANYELKIRSKYYAQQIGTTLGISPDRVGAGDLRKAAEINPALRRVVDEVEGKRAKENSSSMLINTGVTAASFIGLGGVAKLAGEATTGAKILKGGAEMAKVTAGAMAGGALAGVLHKEQVQTQELIEAVEKNLTRAQQEGQPATAAINPYITFMIRVTQDPVAHKEINTFAKKHYGKPFHQLGTQQLDGIMQQEAYASLAHATGREAAAIANGDLNVRDLAASAPFLGEGFAGPMARDDRARGSFVQREQARRAANGNTSMGHAERIAMQNATRGADQGLSA